MLFRKDIQILRGLSVLLVVIFHLELGVFKSGYLGVDIFFVISGFLMAILYKSDRTAQFFVRRARRLLPAYFATILCVLIFSYYLVLPHEFEGVTSQSLYATILSSNIGFWLENSYFDKDTFKPLLHLWSLGVEIQFYILVPFLLWFFKKQKSLIFIFTILSLIACFFVTEISSKSSFFGTPFRLWEFLFGVIVAKHLTLNGSVKYNKYSIVSIPALILVFLIPVMKIESASHPGIHALVISLAVAVILAFGIHPRINNSIFGTVLERIGEYSYSIYLVHFPVIVLYLYTPFSGNNLKMVGVSDTILLISFIILLSLFMYHAIEVPFRNSKGQNQRMIYVGLTALFVAIFSIFGVNIQKSNFTKEEILILNAWSDRAVYRCGTLRRVISPGSASCELTKPVNAPSKRLLLVGNSHADAIKSTFSTVAEKYNVYLRLMVNNDTLGQGIYDVEFILTEALKYNINTIVLHDSPKSIDISNILELVEMTSKYNIEVAFIDPVPVWEEHIPQALWNEFNYGDKLSNNEIEDYEKFNKELFSKLDKIKNSNFFRFKVGHLFCNDSCMKIDSAGRPLYFDSGHLTLTGSMLMKDVFTKIVVNKMVQ